MANRKESFQQEPEVLGVNLMHIKPWNNRSNKCFLGVCLLEVLAVENPWENR